MVIDLSPIVAMNLNNYSTIFQSNLNSLLKGLDDNIIEMVEESITKNILFCLIKKIEVANIHLFDLALDVVNETLKTTIQLPSYLIPEAIKYIESFKQYLNAMIIKFKIPNDVDLEIFTDYKMIFKEYGYDFNSKRNLETFIR